MVIFQRALLREFGNYASAVFAVLFAIAVTTQFVRLLSRAAGGKIPTDAILALIGYTAMNYLPILLALTLFVSVLMAVSRSYKDSEMVVWSASGLSLLAWVRPVLVFAVPIVLLTGVLALFLSPWTNMRAEEYRRNLENREEVSRIAPGVFRESANSDRVFFVEGVDGEVGRVSNIFVVTSEKGKTGVIVSREGFIEVTPEGDRFAVLLSGRRYEGVPGTPEYTVSDFERYAARIKSRQIQSHARSPKTQPTLDLVRSANPEWRAELMWRIGLPLMALNLALLAIPLAFVNPRASRSVNLVFAVLAYMVYSNLLGIMQAWVAQGKVRFETGWWSLHAGMLALTLLLFAWRNTLGFRLLWRR
jgi:lipopolysaccharide export system permease protein